ncbi:MAG: ECF-type sigma factor [Rhodanobacteraceae bacterium]
MNRPQNPELPAGIDDADAPLWASLYDELRGLARQKLRAESSPDLLQTTALVHEAWLRLGGHDAGMHGRQHFMRLAARVMRHVLIDQARALRGRQRDPGRLRVTLDSHIPGSETVEPTELLDIDDALTRLAADNARWADVLELHYFGGMTYAEIADTLALSEATIKRDLRSARAWLLAEIAAEPDM